MAHTVDIVARDDQVMTDDSRTRLIAARLRQTASSVEPLPEDRLAPFAFEQLTAGDVAHLHRTHDIRHIAVASHRPRAGKAVAAVKRLLLRLMYPLLDIQTTWNGANARLMTHLLRQVAAQARSIEALEHELAELRTLSRSERSASTGSAAD